MVLISAFSTVTAAPASLLFDLILAATPRPTMRMIAPRMNHFIFDFFFLGAEAELEETTTAGLGAGARVGFMVQSMCEKSGSTNAKLLASGTLVPRKTRVEGPTTTPP